MKIYIFILMTSVSPWCFADDATAGGELQIASNEPSSTATAEYMLQECARMHAARAIKERSQDPTAEIRRTDTHAYNQAWTACIERDRLGDGLKKEDLTRIMKAAVEKARREAALPRST